MQVWNRAKKFGAGVVICTALIACFSLTTKPDVLTRILQKLQVYHHDHAQEKLYLHFDKPFYAAGDTMWFKAYLVEASLHTPDSQSRVIYAELVDSSYRTIQRRILPVTAGLAYGDFVLHNNLHQGKYLIRAYTNYMRNVGEEFFFRKEFSILNPRFDYTGTHASDIFHPDSIELLFLPEGGNFVACGSPVRVAFKALSPDGSGFPAEGFITDDRDSVVTDFKAEHDGMGRFVITPRHDRHYYAQITNPYGIKRLYKLPEARQRGVILRVDKTKNYLKVSLNTSADINDQEIHLVIQSRGKAYYAMSGKVRSNAWFSFIPVSKLPHGISTVTIFDSLGRPIAERLIFQNHNEELSLKVKTDTDSYGARQKVIVYLDALYSNNATAQGSFSISVYDDKLLPTPEKYPITIKNYLALTSDLTGTITDPGYYFKDTLNTTSAHLDLLMMTNGWRRFSWQDVLEGTLPALFPHERGIPIRGKVVKQWKDKPVAESRLKLLTMTGQGVILNPDSLGNFYTDELIFYDTIDLVARTENLKGKRQPYKFRIRPLDYPPVLSSISAFIPFDASKYTKQQNEQRTLLRLSDISQLEEFTISAKRIERRMVNPWGKIVDVRKTRNLQEDIYQLLLKNVNGLSIKGEHPTITAKLNGRTPKFKVNGDLEYPLADLNHFEPGDVEMIEITKFFFDLYKYSPKAVAMMKKNNRSLLDPIDVINILVSPDAYTADIMGTNQVKYAGFYQAREFYSPRYETKNQVTIPDKRTTLFWEPMLRTDVNGRAAIAFYTADVASRYRIVIEGITNDGYPGTATTTFEVK